MQPVMQPAVLYSKISYRGWGPVFRSFPILGRYFPIAQRARCQRDVVRRKACQTVAHQKRQYGI